LPNRIIRESITTSQSWDALSFSAEAFCTRLITVVDDHGRQDARPSVLRAKCFPLKLAKVTEAVVAKWLGELVEARLVVVYVGDNGGQYLQFVNWTKYQNVRARESKFPAPCEQMIADAIKCDQVIADVPVTRYSDLGSRNSESESGDARPAARSSHAFDEQAAHEYASAKGYDLVQTCRMLESFLAFWESRGWRDRVGPVKDRNARWRTWVLKEIEAYPPKQDVVVQPGERDPRTGRIRVAV
jgi:hypothetical protein